jgi:F0F1-type ATP synthase assembly protein I
VRWLLWRSSIDTFRNPFEFRLRLIVSVIIGVLFGLLFLRLHYDQQAYQNISAVIFLLIINIAFSNVEKNAGVMLNRSHFDLLICDFSSF